MENAFEDVSYEPLFNMHKKDHNNKAYVMVRLMCSKKMPIDFTTGIIKRKKSEADEE